MGLTILEFNNALAIKENGYRQGMRAQDWADLPDTWKGSIGMDDRGYANFQALDGIPAHALCVRAFLRSAFRWSERFQDAAFCKQRDHAHNDQRKIEPGFTLSRFVREYAPVKEQTHNNNPESYARSLAHISGIERDQVLDLFKPNGQINWPLTLDNMAQGIAQIETGNQSPLDYHLVEIGMTVYQMDFVQP